MNEIVRVRPVFADYELASPVLAVGVGNYFLRSCWSSMRTSRSAAYTSFPGGRDDLWRINRFCAEPELAVWAFAATFPAVYCVSEFLNKPF